LGAAYLAGLHVGYWNDVAEIARHWSLDREFLPELPVARRERLCAGWRKAVQRSLHWDAPESV
jgi:glycerol kinase